MSGLGEARRECEQGFVKGREGGRYVVLGGSGSHRSLGVSK